MHLGKTNDPMLEFQATRIQQKEQKHGGWKFTPAEQCFSETPGKEVCPKLAHDQKSGKMEMGWLAWCSWWKACWSISYALFKILLSPESNSDNNETLVSTLTCMLCIMLVVFLSTCYSLLFVCPWNKSPGIGCVVQERDRCTTRLRSRISCKAQK